MTTNSPALDRPEPPDQFTLNASFDASGANLSEEYTTKTGDVEVPPRSTTPIIAYLPLKATVLRVRYYSNASGPSGDHPRPILVRPGKHDNWSEIFPHQIFTTPSNTVVQFKIYNESHNRTRRAAMEVDWRD